MDNKNLIIGTRPRSRKKDNLEEDLDTSEI